MYFRPLPILTLIAIPALMALVWLGVWQSQRAGEKAAEIAAFSDQMKATPLSPEQACAAGLTESQIMTPPPLTQGPMLRVFGHHASGAAGWRQFQAGSLCGLTLLVETGFEALEIGGPGGAPLRPPPPAPDRFIVAPWPGRALMSAANAHERNEWSWFDAPAMASALGVPGLDSRYLLVPLTGLPDYLVRTPPETHVGYAVTWFGIAIAFLVIYGLMHARAGRLRFGKAQNRKANDGKANG